LFFAIEYFCPSLIFVVEAKSGAPQSGIGWGESASKRRRLQLIIEINRKSFERMALVSLNPLLRLMSHFPNLKVSITSLHYKLASKGSIKS
jgi:hypothetical protein